MDLVLRQLSVQPPKPVVQGSFFGGGLLRQDDSDGDEEPERSSFGAPPMQQQDPAQLPASPTPNVPPTPTVEPPKTPVDVEHQLRHIELIKRGLRYVNCQEKLAGIRGILDNGDGAPGQIRHGTPVRVLGTSGGHSKVSCPGRTEGVWVLSSFLTTEEPAKCVIPRHLPTANLVALQGRHDAAATSAPCNARRFDDLSQTRGEVHALSAPRVSKMRRPDDFAEARIDESLLPPDAPPEHQAHIRVRYNGTHTNPLVSFRYNGSPFQTTVAAAGSQHAAEVIARACWLRFEQGSAKDAVLRFRNDCYARVNSGFVAKRAKIDHQEAYSQGVNLRSEVDHQGACAPQLSLRMEVDPQGTCAQHVNLRSEVGHHGASSQGPNLRSEVDRQTASAQGLNQRSELDQQGDSALAVSLRSEVGHQSTCAQEGNLISEVGHQVTCGDSSVVAVAPAEQLQGTSALPCAGLPLALGPPTSAKHLDSRLLCEAHQILHPLTPEVALGTRADHQGACASEVKLRREVNHEGACAKEANLRIEADHGGACAQKENLRIEVDQKGACAEEADLSNKANGIDELLRLLS